MRFITKLMLEKEEEQKLNSGKEIVYTMFTHVDCDCCPLQQFCKDKQYTHFCPLKTTIEVLEAITKES